MFTKFLWRPSLAWVFNEYVRGYIVVVHAPIPTALAASVFCSRRQSRRLEVNMMERLFTRMRTSGPLVLSLFLFFAAREVWNTRPQLMIIWLVGTVCWLVGEIYARWQHKRLDWPEWVLAFKRGYQGNTN